MLIPIRPLLGGELADPFSDLNTVRSCADPKVAVQPGRDHTGNPTRRTGEISNHAPGELGRDGEIENVADPWQARPPQPGGPLPGMSPPAGETHRSFVWARQRLGGGSVASRLGAGRGRSG